MRRVPRSLVAVVALCALWLVLIRGYADYLARPLPARALALDGNQPEALVRSAEGALREGKADQAEAYARQALRRHPLEGRALRILGATAELRGDRVAARALMAAAAAATPRDSATQFWLAINALADRDLDTALVKLDRLVRFEPELQSDVFPILATIATNPVGAPAIAPFLTANAPWRTRFIEGLIGQAPAVEDLMRLVRAIEQAGGRLSEAEVDRLAQRLWAGGDWRRLRTLLAREAGAEATPALVRDGGFDGTGRGPFLGWAVRRVPGADTWIGAEPGSGRSVLHVSFHDRRVAYAHVQQALMLDPGRYRLTAQARLANLRTARGLRWVLSCTGRGQPIGQSELLLGSTDWRPVSAHFEVPAENCGGQLLTLMLEARIAAEQQVAGDAWFDDLQILPESLLSGTDMSLRGSVE